MTRLTIHKAAQLAQAGIGVRVYPDGTWETVRLDTSESAGEPSSLREWRERRENAQGRTSYKNKEG